MIILQADFFSPRFKRIRQKMWIFYYLPIFIRVSFFPLRLVLRNQSFSTKSCDTGSQIKNCNPSPDKILLKLFSQHLLKTLREFFIQIGKKNLFTTTTIISDLRLLQVLSIENFSKKKVFQQLDRVGVHFLFNTLYTHKHNMFQNQMHMFHHLCHLLLNILL